VLSKTGECKKKENIYSRGKETNGKIVRDRTYCQDRKKRGLVSKRSHSCPLGKRGESLLCRKTLQKLFNPRIPSLGTREKKKRGIRGELSKEKRKKGETLLSAFKRECKERKLIKTNSLPYTFRSQAIKRVGCKYLLHKKGEKNSPIPPGRGWW